MGGKRLMDQPQHVRPWPPKTLRQPSKGREILQGQRALGSREDWGFGAWADLRRIPWCTGDKPAGVIRLKAPAFMNPTSQDSTAAAGMQLFTAPLHSELELGTVHPAPNRRNGPHTLVPSGAVPYPLQ